MNKVLLKSLVITEIQRYFTISIDFTKVKSLSPILHCHTSKVESDREKEKMFNNYCYSVFTSSDFVLPNMEELAKSTKLSVGITDT